MTAPAAGGASLWLARAPATAYPALEEDLDVDVAVIGGGIAGISAAHACKRDGARVAVLERGVVAGGATGFTTAKVTALQATMLSEIAKLHGADGAAAYAAASLAAVARVGDVVRDEAIDCAWQRADAYTYAAGEQQVDAVEREADAALAAGLDVQLTTDVPLPFAVAQAVRLRDQAQLDPVRYVRGLAAIVDRGGSHVFERTAVAGVEEGRPCRVHTAGGQTVTARDVIVATNYPLLDRGLFFARMEAERSYLVAARVRGEATDAMLITAGQPTRSMRSHRDGADTWLLVGGEGHPTGSDEAQPGRYAVLERFARARFDVVEIAYRWSTQDGMPSDRLPYAGPYTLASTHLFVAAGFQKWGMTSATVAAGVLADRIAGRRNPYAALLDPNRATVRAAPEVARLGLRVARHLVADRISPAQARSAADVAPGEARIVRSGLGKVGVVRDDDGIAHGVSLRCTHLGCLLRFNAAERTWDCPCHGSRFDVDGSVLAGPATQPLERREVR